MENQEEERASVAEGSTFNVDPPSQPLRTFELSLRGVRAQVCSLGASLTNLVIPSPDGDHDIVLGYKSPSEMFQSGNPSFLSVVVGRVANRIAKGRLILDGSSGERPFQLAINNEPNHLHGGEEGFSRRNWEAEIVQINFGNASHDAVRFSYTSPSGDQGYPGTIKCSAIYCLRPCEEGNGVSLCLDLSADLDGEERTPVNLAQHSYFNLSKHDDPNGVLDHKLTLPSNFYCPLDETSIPTREVKHLNDDTTMDWRAGRRLRDAMEDFAVSKAGLDAKLATKVISDRSLDPTKVGLQPFGFDHNYVVNQSAPDKGGLHHVATLTHEGSKRTLNVRTSSPGAQLYTANYLSASDPSPSQAKDGASYLRWQGLCLETQHYPDSVAVNEKAHPEFFKGKCVVLSPSNPSYRHTVVYDLDFEKPTSRDNDTRAVFRGNDSRGNSYDSVENMWQAQGVSDTNKSEWYDRASQYYEENCPETIDGVLGGFANISDLDLEGSRGFVKELEQQLGAGWTWSVGGAAECGAGIGRVSKGLLLRLDVPRCDLVESSSRLLSAAPEYIGLESSRCRFFCQGLQNWMPAKETYSLIWVQWVFCYLTDTDAVSFLRRCGEALVQGGVICLKENACSDTDFVLDSDDASVTRSVPYLLHLAKQAGLKVVLMRHQTNVSGMAKLVRSGM